MLYDIHVAQKINRITNLDYFTDIDESLVETSDLFVKTNDSSVFTKNTNVVSNYDNVYIISFASVEEARFAYSYYVDGEKYDNSFHYLIKESKDIHINDTVDVYYIPFAPSVSCADIN